MFLFSQLVDMPTLNCHLKMEITLYCQQLKALDQVMLAQSLAHNEKIVIFNNNDKNHVMSLSLNLFYKATEIAQSRNFDDENGKLNNTVIYSI